MSTDLMIPTGAEVPAHAKAAKGANDMFSEGISTGMPPRVKLSGKQFTLVDGNGDERPFPPNELIQAPDGNIYMGIIALAAVKSLQRAWYATAYNPNEEGRSPDCFSLDNERPDKSATNPQADSCAMCPNNAFGSGKDQNGNPTKGKACAESKVMAVLIPKAGVHSLKIPPASLKNFGLYVKQLSNAGIDLTRAKTLIGFDPKVSYPVVTFAYGGFLDAALVPKLQELSQSAEVMDIVNVTAPVPTSAPVQEAKVAQPVVEPSTEVVADVSVDDLMGGGNTAPAQEAKVEQPVSSGPAEMSDADLMAELGL